MAIYYGCYQELLISLPYDVIYFVVSCSFVMVFGDVVHVGGATCQELGCLSAHHSQQTGGEWCLSELVAVYGVQVVSCCKLVVIET